MRERNKMAIIILFCMVVSGKTVGRTDLTISHFKVTWELAVNEVSISGTLYLVTLVQVPT